jgi:hypothetical protein
MKSRARFLRWDEDVRLLLEEMRRVLVFLSWQAKWWSLQGTHRSNVDGLLDEGLRAYAAKQASIRFKMAKSFAREWYPVLAAFGIDEGIRWPAEFVDALPQGPSVVDAMEILEEDEDYVDVEDIFD